MQRFWSGLFGFTGYGGVFLLFLVCVGFCFVLFCFCRGRNVLFLLFVIQVDFVIPEPG